MNKKKCSRLAQTHKHYLASAMLRLTLFGIAYLRFLLVSFCCFWFRTVPCTSLKFLEVPCDSFSYYSANCIAKDKWWSQNRLTLIIKKDIAILNFLKSRAYLVASSIYSYQYWHFLRIYLV